MWYQNISEGNIKICSWFKKGKCNKTDCMNLHIKEPELPDKKDCYFFVSTGTCKNGEKCKFNHYP